MHDSLQDKLQPGVLPLWAIFHIFYATCLLLAPLL